MKAYRLTKAEDLAMRKVENAAWSLHDLARSQEWGGASEDTVGERG